MTKALKLSLVVVALSFLSACGTIGSRATVKAKLAPGDHSQIRSVYVVVRSTDDTEKFVTPFFGMLKARLQAMNMDVGGRITSDLDIEPITQGMLQPFDYVLLVEPTDYTRDAMAILRLHLTCALYERASRILVMKATIESGRGFGYGYGENEADHASEKLVSKFVELGLIGARQ